MVFLRRERFEHAYELRRWGREGRLEIQVEKGQVG